MRFQLINVEILQYKNQHFSLWHGEGGAVSAAHPPKRSVITLLNKMPWTEYCLVPCLLLHTFTGWLRSSMLCIHTDSWCSCFICTEKHGDAISHKPKREEKNKCDYKQEQGEGGSCGLCTREIGVASWLKL